MLLLSQVQSTILFTSMRITLQLATTYLITQILARAYNLTYIERADAGLFSKLRFVFMTRYSNSNKHLFGRFLIMLIVIITVLLTGLPYLLTKLYPVKLTSLGTQIFNITTDNEFGMTVYLNPNSTSEADLSSTIGLPLGAYSFDRYSIPAPKSVPWKHMADSSTTYLAGPYIGGFSVTQYFDSADDRYPLTKRPGNTSAVENIKAAMENIKGTSLTYFNLTNSDADDLVMRKIDICLEQYDNTQQYCSTHTINFESLGSFPITQVYGRKSVYINLPPVSQFNSTYCMYMPTPSLQHKCQVMTDIQQLSYNYTGFFGVQNIVNTTNGVRIEAVWIKGDIDFLNIQAITSDVEITLYESSSKISVPIEFTTTYKRSSNNNAVVLPPFLMNMGFPQESVDNITNFILRGISDLGGSMVVSTTGLVAKIPEALIIAVFAAALLCVIGGYIATLGVDPMVTRPLSEIIAASRTNPEGSSFKRKVVHLTLARNRGISKSSPTIFVDSTRLDVENDEIQLLESEDIESCSSTLR